MRQEKETKDLLEFVSCYEGVLEVSFFGRRAMWCLHGGENLAKAIDTGLLDFDVQNLEMLGELPKEKISCGSLRLFPVYTSSILGFKPNSPPQITVSIVGLTVRLDYRV